MFQNRSEAGRLLAMHLQKFQNDDVLLLAIPRGGVPVAYEVAKQFNWPMDVMLIKKLGHPHNKEYAIGAVGLEDRIVEPHHDVSNEYIESETIAVRNRLQQMRSELMGEKPPENVKGKTAILIDDGIATGRTVKAAVQILRKQQPAKIIVAAPVASFESIEDLSKEADEVIVVYVPENFFGVGQFYYDFSQTTDEEVIGYMQKLKENS